MRWTLGGIAGLLYRDGRPVDPDDVEAVLSPLAPRAVSGAANARVDGSVALVHASYPTTPEAQDEPEPLVDAQSGCQLVFDGRVDNRKDLLKLLGASTPLTDAEVVLAAFLRWGTACFAQIVGDFALAIWDPRSCRAICLRDSIGMKPLYFASRDSRLVWSTELASVLAPRWIHPTPNEVVVAEHLFLVARVSMTETVYAGIERLPPAHLLVADRRGVRVEKYWDLDPAHRIRYRSDDEYADHLRDVLTEAVRCRMRTVGPVFTELSGGLDSSMVTAIALSLSSVKVPLEALSMIFPGTDTDQSAFIDQVVRWCELPSKRFEPAPSSTLDFFAEVQETKEPPCSPFSAMWDPLLKYAHHSGGRALLMGVGGDEWFGGNRFILPDELLKLRWLTVARRLYQPDRIPWLAPRPIRDGLLRPLGRRWAPATIRERIRRRHQVGLNAYVNPTFAAGVRLEDDVQTAPERGNWEDLAHAELAQRLYHTWYVANIEDNTSLCIRSGLEARMPLYDRRVVEFALAIPEQQWVEPTQTKAVLRRVAGPLLPPEIVRRWGHTPTAQPYAEVTLNVGADLLRSPLRTEQEGWVDGTKVRGGYAAARERYRRGDRSSDYEKSLAVLWRALALEIWFRAYTGSATP